MNRPRPLAFVVVVAGEIDSRIKKEDCKEEREIELLIFISIAPLKTPNSLKLEAFIEKDSGTKDSIFTSLITPFTTRLGRKSNIEKQIKIEK